MLVVLAALVAQAGIGEPVPGRLADSYSHVTVSGTNAVGGLVGTLSGASVIERAYSTGSVTGSVDGVGGLLGILEEGSVTDSYWDRETSGQMSSPAGAGRTTAAMIAPHDQDTFVGWDFEGVWTADEILVQNDGYPYLRGALMPCLLIYRAGAGGSVIGAARQLVGPDGIGESVNVQPASGAYFAGWSDGGADATRADGVADADLVLIARFRSAGGADLDWYAGHGFTPGDGQSWSELDDRWLPEKGTTLLQEFIADTDPHDPSSRLRVLGIEPGPPIRVHFLPASDARVYWLQFTDDLAVGGWEDLPGQDPKTGVGGADQLVDPATPPTRFYRVKVAPPSSAPNPE